MTCSKILALVSNELATAKACFHRTCYRSYSRAKASGSVNPCISSESPDGWWLSMPIKTVLLTRCFWLHHVTCDRKWESRKAVYVWDGSVSCSLKLVIGSWGGIVSFLTYIRSDVIEMRKTVSVSDGCGVFNWSLEAKECKLSIQRNISDGT